MTPWTVRPACPEDIPEIISLCRAVYPDSPAWSEEQLRHHQQIFPEGQLVATDPVTGAVVGYAASLVVLWDDYRLDDSWRDFTDGGMFRNHDPEKGHTLYGAEVMSHPAHRGQGVGKALYAARRDLVRRRGLWRIRAGARLCGYHRVADRMSPEDYLAAVAEHRLTDPTLTFQLAQGFRPMALVRNYLRHDPESLGHAVVIEWINPEMTLTPGDAADDSATHAPPPVGKGEGDAG